MEYKHRHIRVFISSTFKGMEDLRTHLMTNVFPRIIHEAKKHNVIVTPIDLRWGITEEASKNGETAKICLREIKNSRPYFIGILGERYGWQPTLEELQVDPQTLEDYPWLKEYAKSKTSMTEIEMQYAVLHNRNKDIDAFFYVSTNKSKNQQQSRLIEQIEKSKDRFPVSYYSSIVELGNKIEMDFLNLLRSRFPIEGNEDNIFNEQDNYQQYLIEHNTIGYIDNHNYDSLVSNNKHKIALVGPTGCGKTSLLSCFVKNKTTNRDLVISYIGNGDIISQEDVLRFLTKQLQKINRKYKVSSLSFEEILKDSRERFENVYIVIDSIENIREPGDPITSNISWIPDLSTYGITTIVSSHSQLKYLLEFGNYEIIEMPELSEDLRYGIIEGTLSRFRKTLENNRIQLIAKDNKSSNGHLLKIMLSEMIYNGVYETYNDYIQEYITTSDENSFYNKLVCRTLKYSGSHTITKALSYILLSKYGILEEDLIPISNLTQMEWSSFYCSNEYLFRRENARLKFFNHKIHLIIEQLLASRPDFMELRLQYIKVLRDKISDIQQSVRRPSKKYIKLYLGLSMNSLDYSDELSNQIYSYLFRHNNIDVLTFYYKEIAYQYFVTGNEMGLKDLFTTPEFIFIMTNTDPNIYMYWDYVKIPKTNAAEFFANVNLAESSSEFISDYYFCLSILMNNGIATIADARIAIKKSLEYLDKSLNVFKDTMQSSRIGMLQQLGMFDDIEERDLSNVSTLELEVNRAKIAFNKRNYEDAIKIAKSILNSDKLNTDLEESHKIKAACHVTIANSYAIISHYLSGSVDDANVANESFVDAIAIYEDLYRKNPDKYEDSFIELLNDYACFLQESSNLELAAEIYKLILPMFETKTNLVREKERYAQILLNYTGLHTDIFIKSHNSANYDEAIESINKSCDLLYNLYISDRLKYSELYSDALYNKARLLKSDSQNYCKEYEIEALYKKCIDLYSSIEIKDKVARSYCGLALYQVNSKKIADAKTNFEEAYSIYKNLSKDQQGYNIYCEEIERQLSCL